MKPDPTRRIKRKERTTSSNMCTCGYFNCDSSHGMCNTPYIRKLEKRKDAGVCIACGKKECKCKRKASNGIIPNEERRIKMKQYIDFLRSEIKLKKA